MLKILVPSIVNAAAIAGGIFGGQMLRPGDNVPAHAAPSTTLPGEGHPANDDTGHGEETDHATSADQSKTGASHGEPPEGDYYPMRFARPFVVPVSDGWQTQALVVIQLNLELNREAMDNSVGLEEKLRDRIMSALIAYSHNGGFAVTVTDPELRTAVHDVVLSAADELLPDQVGDVLILEMLKRKV
ncbi:hypothetical protein [Parvularcula sp. LCG005]|uniref:hypothetical protein n=1 Tax=Parvularcula sp. LCG005 TaxID=3078805 RepID=UPI002942E23C|nr:hypothetical protein [Parvularcula sp. LCG005]WOI52954.1 hypothetical protein RUI03_12430 [Parvularcula sp. LCG005]